ncbi:hypothetical protein [Mycobacteroides immunogenum]|uniref:Uncharacterized protein n=1 Tax=Mycobacteroides immunogenum TaxID=83262 RepID=A0ABR5LKH5_9MYCO|nr:hypothetical protein [Mycobacteroides immunogenum]KPG26218.1 hypothetical protein AN912_25555 [Mycobacteroides immunogenum]KPG31837.1 hypothetical protein AN914_26070 [Mycobacteroides immunogenum]
MNPNTGLLALARTNVHRLNLQGPRRALQTTHSAALDAELAVVCEASDHLGTLVAHVVAPILRSARATAPGIVEPIHVAVAELWLAGREWEAAVLAARFWAAVDAGLQSRGLPGWPAQRFLLSLRGALRGVEMPVGDVDALVSILE